MEELASATYNKNVTSHKTRHLK